MKVFLLALCFILTAEVALSLQSNTVLHVDSIKGKDDTQCLKGQHPCEHLEYISNELTGKNDCSNLTIVVDSPTLKVNKTVKFESCNVLKLVTGSNIVTANISCTKSEDCVASSSTHSYENTEEFNTRDKYCVPNYPNCTKPNVGLVFEGVNSLSISNVTIKNCGAYAELGTMNLSAAVHVQNSFNVILQNVTFENSEGTALSLFNTFGNVNIENVRFLHNIHSIHSSFVGGVHVKFLSSAPASYIFKDCYFKNNSAPCYEEYRPNLTPKLKDLDTYGLGGAMSVLFTNESQNIDMIVMNCTFVNNTAPWGAGLYVHFQDNLVNNNTVIVSDSHFNNNTAYLGGGGAMIGYDRFSSPNQMNRVLFRSTTFNLNQARYGGGTSVFALFNDYRSQPHDSVVFDNCTWENNSAFYSPAVDVSPYRLDELNTGFLPIPVFKDCLIKGNYLNYRNNQKGTAYVTSGVFVVSRFTVKFLETITFVDNRMTALLLNSARCIVSPGTSVSFESNTGILGGAVAMYGFAVLLINDNVQFVFTNNSARGCGGGIYYHSNEQRDFLEGRSCFLQYLGSKTPSNISFLFENNTATDGGSSIFSVSFYSCFFRYLGSLAKHDLTDFFKVIGNFTFNDLTSETDYLATSGVKFSSNSPMHNIQAFPGYPVFVNLTLTDELDSIVNTDLSLSIKDDGTHISLHEHYTTNKSITVFGHPLDNGTVILSTRGLIREVFHDVDVTLLQCPPGYFLNNLTKACQCSADDSSQAYSGIIKCNDAQLQAYIRHGFWAGYYNPNEPNDDTIIGDPEHLYTGYCPLEFCQPNYVSYTFHLMPNNSKYLNGMICTKYRQGVMCGQCIGNHSVYYHSRHFKCGKEDKCHLGILFYILSELLPMVILFVVVIASNVSFTSGSVTGLILFSQLVHKLTIDYKHFNDHHNTKFGPLNHLREIYLIVYGIFNFDFFNIDSLSFCLWRAASVLDVLIFKYLTTVTALILVITLIGILNTKYCLRICNDNKRQSTETTVKKSVIHGLSAFLIICYAQCTDITFRILTRVVLWGNSNAQPSTAIMAYYGGISYFTGKHLLYTIPALLVLITIVTIPPVFLLLNPLLLNLLALCGLSEHPFVMCLMKVLQCNRLMPLFDCFQSTFKDNMRFFAGFYFLYRVCILGTYTFSTGEVSFYGISELFLVLFLGITAIAQPHKQRKHNILDSLLILNLVVINGLSMFAASEETRCNENDSFYGLRAEVFVVAGSMQIVLVYTPMICVVCYWVYKLLKLKKQPPNNHDVDDYDEFNEEDRELLLDSDRSGSYGGTQD